MQKIILYFFSLCFLSSLSSFAQKDLQTEGRASYYGTKFHGKKTASGELFNMHLMTAAHKRIPFNSLVKVTNTSNNKSVIVRINDRGPYSKSRIIDVSKAAAERLGMIEEGVANVIIEVLHPKSIIGFKQIHL